MFFEKQQVNKPYRDIFKEMYYEARPQTNYHGTPYTFDKFDDSKWLTGEGFAAHGPGHYSADSFKVADLRYRLPKQNIYNIKTNSIIDVDPNAYANKISNYKLKDYLINHLKYNKDYGHVVGDYVTRSTVERSPLAMDIIKNPDDYTIKIDSGNTYKVNVPNEYFMWREGLPLSEQTPYIRDAWYKNNFDYGKLLNDWSIDHDLEGIKLPNDKKFWRVYNKSIDHYGEIKPILRRIFSNQMQALDLPDQLKFLKRSGNLDKLSEAMGNIKGIRAIGSTDGPINVTFSSDDIKMANTPWQRFKNRIPLNSLGVLANKIISSPWFRAANEYVVPFQAGLEYYPQLDLILEKDPKEYSKKYNRYMGITPNKPGYMDEQGYLNY